MTVTIDYCLAACTPEFKKRVQELSRSNNTYLVDAKTRIILGA